MRLFWIRGHNFGDVLNPLLYKFMTGREAEYSEDPPKVLAIGSVMHKARSGDIIWGTGVIDPEIPLQIDHRVLIKAVRGPLTAGVLRSYGIHVPEIYGEPSWLLPMFVKPAEMRDNVIGFLPHYIDYGQAGKLPENVRLLSPATEPISLIKQITACRVIVSSSLHGVCVAEAYGIPAMWVELSDLILGKGFKFRDYYAATGRNVQPLNWKEKRNWEEINMDTTPFIPPRSMVEQLYESCPF